MLIFALFSDLLNVMLMFLKLEVNYVSCSTNNVDKFPPKVILSAPSRSETVGERNAAA